MAIRRDVYYSGGRWEAATTEQPSGAFKNRSAPGATDGSFTERSWANDWSAFFDSLLDAAGVAHNGTVDYVGASQYFDAFQAASRAAMFLGQIDASVTSPDTLADKTGWYGVVNTGTTLPGWPLGIGNSGGILKTCGETSYNEQRYIDNTTYGPKEHTRITTAGVISDWRTEGDSEIGKISCWGADTLPYGCLVCNSQIVHRQDYPRFFEIYEIAEDTHALPELRGEFIRGLDDGRGVDLGRGLITWQDDSMQPITGSFGGVRTGTFDNSHADGVFTKSPYAERAATDTFSNGVRYNFDSSLQTKTSHETRPRNIALRYIIKLK